MSTQLSNLQQTRKLKRTQHEQNLSCINLDSSSSEKDTQDKMCKRTKNSSGRPATKNSTRASVGLDDLQNFSKSLIKDFKIESQKMLAQFKKDLRNVEATNSTMMTRKGKGVLIRGTSQALTTDQSSKKSTVNVKATNSTMMTRKDRGKGVLIRRTCSQALTTDQSSKRSPVSGPQSEHKATRRDSSAAPNAVQQYYEQHMNFLASRNVIPPAGHDAYRRTCFNYGRNRSAPNAVHQHGYFTNLLAQVTRCGNWPYRHQNSIQTSGIGSSFPMSSVPQRLGNTYHVPFQTVAGSSYDGNRSGLNFNGGSAVFSRSGHGLCNNVVANNRHSK